MAQEAFLILVAGIRLRPWKDNRGDTAAHAAIDNSAVRLQPLLAQLPQQL